jgi:hypothetical protein
MVDFSIDNPQGYDWFNKEMFTSSHTKEFVEQAKDVVKQLQNKYDAGDVSAQKAVRAWEGKRLMQGEQVSGDKLKNDSIQDLFYEAFQRSVGSALTNEDKELPPSKRQFLESIHGFDMGGYKPFDWSAVSGLKLPEAK